MRNNQPVIDQEYVLPEDVILVSKTDLNGTIVECNDEFEKASGYTRDELMGQPHNLVRHPDVPEQVFQDLWRTLETGSPWTQIVKNRRKDGTHYWVRATATPIYEHGQIVGYMSVRYPASAMEKSQATAAYEAIAAGRLRLRKGAPETVWQNLVNLYNGLGICVQLLFLSLLVVALPSWLVYEFWSAEISLMVATGTAAVLSFVTGGWFRGEIEQKMKGLKLLASGQTRLPDMKNSGSIFGRLGNLIQATSLAVGAQKAESLYREVQSNIVRTAMDQAVANILIADHAHNIHYMNDYFKAKATRHGETLRHMLNVTDVDELYGKSLEAFSVVLQDQQSPFMQLVSGGGEGTLSFVMDECQYDVHVKSVVDSNDLVVATLIEFIDRTDEVQVKNQVIKVVEGTQKGMLHQRIETTGLQGNTLELSRQLNAMMDAIERPIMGVVDVAVSISEGKLNKYVEGHYSGRFGVLKDSLNVAVDNMSSLIAQTQAATNNVYSGSKQINQASLDLNDRTQNQAASLEQTAASMEQMTATVKQNAANSQDAARFTQDAADKAENGVQVMDNAIASMREINDSSQKINDIIGLIDSIAFQTNLLALNAAVEAARAGEHGRGFAVVAGEVRTLAQKSAEAAKDIRGLIEDSVAKIGEGTKHVEISGQSLHDIVGAIESVNQLIEEMANSSNEQSEGIAQVNSAINSIDTAVQQNAALVEESTATAEELSSMSELMKAASSQFEVMTGVFSGNLYSLDAGVDFNAAKAGHRAWRVKARAYLNDMPTSFDPNVATEPDKCALGQWLYGKGKQFSALPTYQQLEQSHAEFHQFIGTIFDLKAEGDYSLAITKLDELEERSRVVIGYIDALESEIAGAGATAMLQAKRTAKAQENPAPDQTPVTQPKVKTQPKPVSASTTSKPAASAPSAVKPVPKKPVASPLPKASASTLDDSDWEDF